MTARRRCGRVWTGCLLIALAGGARADVPAAALGDPERDVLSLTDAVPTTAQIRAGFGLDPGPRLRTIAAGDEPGATGPHRVRALALLRDDPSPEAREVLRATVQDLLGAITGADAVLLRTAALSLGAVGDATDVDLLVQLLGQEGNRDLRAAAATALGALGTPAAIDPLRLRYAVETSGQVRLKISEALRLLGG